MYPRFISEFCTPETTSSLCFVGPLGPPEIEDPGVLTGRPTERGNAGQLIRQQLPYGG